MNERSEEELLSILEEIRKQHPEAAQPHETDKFNDQQKAIIKAVLAMDLVSKATNLTKDELSRAKLLVMRAFKTDIAISMTDYILDHARSAEHAGQLVASFNQHTRKRRLELSVELIELIDSLEVEK